METNPFDFFEKYELLNSSNTYISTHDKANTCRYCGRMNGETTFNQETHLLPELMGENNVTTSDECDICNILFSDYESSLSIFIRPYITLLGIKGKKKVPAFQSRSINQNELTRTTLKHQTENKKELYIGPSDDFLIKNVKKTFDLLFRKPPFIPLKVYKSLLKIGLSLLPNKYDEFNSLSFAWLSDKQSKHSDLDFIPYVFISRLNNISFKNPFAVLYKAKKLFLENEEFPEYSLVIYFANQLFQIFLPFSDEFKNIHDKQRKLILTLFPTDLGEVNPYNLSIAESITEDHTISFSYEDMETKDSKLMQ